MSKKARLRHLPGEGGVPLGISPFGRKDNKTRLSCRGKRSDETSPKNKGSLLGDFSPSPLLFAANTFWLGFERTTECFFEY